MPDSMGAEMLQKYIFVFNIIFIICFYLKNCGCFLFNQYNQKDIFVTQEFVFKENGLIFNQNIFVK